LDQPLHYKGIDEADKGGTLDADKGGTLDADGCSQILLANPIAKEVKMQEGTPGGIRQSGRLEPLSRTCRQRRVRSPRWQNRLLQFG